MDFLDGFARPGAKGVRFPKRPHGLDDLPGVPAFVGDERRIPVDEPGPFEGEGNSSTCSPYLLCCSGDAPTYSSQLGGRLSQLPIDFDQQSAHLGSGFECPVPRLVRKLSKFSEDSFLPRNLISGDPHRSTVGTHRGNVSPLAHTLVQESVRRSLCSPTHSRRYSAK